MAPITTSYDVVSGDETTLAVNITATQTSGIKLSSMNINGTATAVAATSGVLEIEQAIDGTRRVEWLAFNGVVVNSDNTVTLTDTGVSRDVSRTGSSLTGSGTGQRFNKGAIVRLVVFHFLLNKKANIDRANTFTAAQTFSTGSAVIFTGTDTVGLVVKSLTTAQRDAISSPTNGSIIYNTDTGVLNQYITGAWTTFATGTVSNAADAVGGKVDLATAAEVAAGTATDATSGSPNVIPVSIVKKNSTGATSGTVPCLNTSTMLDGTIGGNGVQSPALGTIFYGSGLGLAMNSRVIGTAGFALTSFGGVPQYKNLTPVGTIAAYAASAAPTDWLLCDGTAVSRATFATLFGVIAPTIGTFTVTLASPGVFTLNSHGLVAGDPVYFTTTGALPTGLTANTIYYVISAGLTSNAFEVSASYGGSAVNTSVSQSGTHTCVKCPFGLGDGSTTFNTPDLRGRYAIAPDGGQSRITANNTFGVGAGTADGAHSHTQTLSATDSNSGGTNVDRSASTNSASVTPPYLVVQYIIKT